MIARILFPLIIVLFLLPVFSLGCSQTNTPKQEINMGTKVTVPVIDASVPTEIETATFALG